MTYSIVYNYQLSFSLTKKIVSLGPETLLWRFQVGDHVEMLKEWHACPERAGKLRVPSHIPCPVHLLYLAILELYPFIINQA